MNDELRRLKVRKASLKYDAEHREERAAKRRMRTKIKRMVEGPAKLRGPNTKPAKNGLPYELWLEAKRRPEETDEEYKRRYNRIKTRHFRNKNPDRARAQRIKDQSKPEYKARAKAYLNARPEMVKAKDKRYFERNRVSRLEKLKAWGQNNKERMREVQRAWFKEHPGVAAASCARARARAVQATPPWVWSLHGKEFDRIYAKCKQISKKTGIPHQVDHIYPLAGKTSCGLHVPWNLQIIPAIENIKKRNKCPEELGYVTA